MNQLQIAPSREVLAAFGLPQVTPRLLADGSGTSWSVTSAILKPVTDSAEASWVAGLYADLRERGFRIPRPLAAADTSYIVDGWCAWKYVAGSHDNQGNWSAMLNACRDFHLALENIDPPGFLATERHHWALADRIAWNESRPAERWSLLETIERLQGQLDSADRRLPRQLIHGDIAGNLLYEEGLEPAVIDFSPFLRPVAWAAAIAVADALAWQHAPHSLLEQSRAFGVTDSLLRRAVIFRLSASCASPDGGIDDRYNELQAYTNVVRLLEG